MKERQASLANHQLIPQLTAYLQQIDLPPLRFMEVCGTHTMAIARYGLRQLMPPAITLTSGPGCPVCVTATADIDTFIAASQRPKTIITTFGDLIKVRGSKSSLQEEMGRGGDIRIVYSVLDALDIARKNPNHEVIFLGVGFETTTPTVAAAVLTAAQNKINNFSVITSHKVMPPALEALFKDPAIKIDGLICPGHVSVIIGADAYLPLVKKYRIPCVIAGFEPLDIMQGVVLLAKQIVDKKSEVEIAYQRAVNRTGNNQARSIMATVFTEGAAVWRGFGEIAASGLHFREEYRHFDARHRFDLTITECKEPAGCRCGEVLKGIIPPPACKLFNKRCHPGHPIGPCMVSSEGACAAFHKYDTTSLHYPTPLSKENR